MAWEKLPTLIARHAKVFGPWGQRSVFCLRFDRKHLVSPDSPCRALDLPYRCSLEADPSCPFRLNVPGVLLVIL